MGKRRHRAPAVPQVALPVQQASAQDHSLQARVVRHCKNQLYVLIVYGTLILTDWAIFGLLWWSLGAEIEKYSIVGLMVDYSKIGLAMLAAFGGVGHGVFSLIGQLRLEYMWAKEPLT